VAGAATGLIGDLQQTAFEAAGLCEETIVPEGAMRPIYSKMLGTYRAWQETLQSCASK
jgi:hypothetical protein